MLAGTQSGCINHPGVEAVIRCKQCGRPVCGACVVSGPTGRFCCEPCKQKHEAFAQHARTLDTKARGAFFVRVRSALMLVLVVAAVLACIGVVASFIYIPVVSEQTDRVRNLIGI